MKDQAALLNLMVSEYETAMRNSGHVGFTLSPHDPIFHAFLSVSHVGDVLSVYADKEARERYILTARRRSSVIAHAIGMGYVPRFLEPDRHMQLITFSDAVPESFTIVKGTRVRTETQDGIYTIAEVMENNEVPVGASEIEVEVEVGQTAQVVIGTGTGQPIALPLEGDYVYVDSLYLLVTTQTGTETWTRVNDFLLSEPEDRHFIVEVGAKSFNDIMKPNDLMLSIRCGNGNSGKVFPEGAQIRAVYREVSPYQDTMPIGVFTIAEDSIPYLETTTNSRITKEKILPEDIEVIRRNAIYTKSVGDTLSTKEDFERAAIIQSVDAVTKAFASWSYDTERGVNVYTIYCSGYEYPLPQDLLDEVRDRMYTNYSRSLTDEYNLVQAPIKDDYELTMDVIFNPELTEDERTSLVATIKSVILDYVSMLSLGETLSVPEMWRRLIELTSNELNGVEYVQFTSVPPTLAVNQELKLTDENITVNDITP